MRALGRDVLSSPVERNESCSKRSAIHLRSVQVRSAELGKAAVFVSMGGSSAWVDKGSIRKKLPWAKAVRESLQINVF
jgi:hypothetical protein